MIITSIIVLLTAALFLGFGIALYKGHTGLIHDYHRKNIPQSDLPAYGKAFSVGMFILGGSLMVSGLIPLCGESKGYLFSSVGVMILGFVVSFIILAKVQKKYNGGFF